MVRLLRRTEEFAADTEAEIEGIIVSATADGGEVTKKTVTLKQRKQKGEIVEEHFKVDVQVTYDTIWETAVSE